VLFALVFAYFAIMAVKLARIERELVELNALADRPRGRQDGRPGARPPPPPSRSARVPAS
jgi:hypothetical protein